MGAALSKKSFWDGSLQRAHGKPCNSFSEAHIELIVALYIAAGRSQYLQLHHAPEQKPPQKLRSAFDIDGFTTLLTARVAGAPLAVSHLLFFWHGNI
ncbi:hypothetical protein, conserved [Eimeria tenella]|uniref:Uncharacterized protein n=1 Tax=Eimeria tenella TaxID=5802 RepID=U6KYR5_EIMTE|nr:hypothetical protein, conserved [Eimeria tenella]CDJ41444.1 hypothetical protein, conserved [Eimeria tenella]|eukprot:XP_013232194.1 hypothetical protein, conserved [Eimeria tenella]